MGASDSNSSIRLTPSPSTGATETTMKKKLKSDSPLDAAARPSSDTPISDSASFELIVGRPLVEAIVAKTLERQANRMDAAIRSILDDIPAASVPHWVENILRDAISENADVEARRK